MLGANLELLLYGEVSVMQHIDTFDHRGKEENYGEKNEKQQQQQQQKNNKKKKKKKTTANSVLGQKSGPAEPPTTALFSVTVSRYVKTENTSTPYRRHKNHYFVWTVPSSVTFIETDICCRSKHGWFLLGRDRKCFAHIKTSSKGKDAKSSWFSPFENVENTKVHILHNACEN